MRDKHNSRRVMLKLLTKAKWTHQTVRSQRLNAWLIFTARRRDAWITSVRPSVRLSVCHTSVLSRKGSTHH